MYFDKSELGKSETRNGFSEALRSQDVIAIDFTTIKKSNTYIENIHVINDIFYKMLQEIPTRQGFGHRVMYTIKSGFRIGSIVIIIRI